MNRETKLCDRPGCVQQTHTLIRGMQADMCITASIMSDTGAWVVRGFFDPRTGRWDAYTDLTAKDGYDGAEGLADLRQIVATHSELQSLCERLNARNHADGEDSNAAELDS